LKLCHNIALTKHSKNYNTPEEILQCDEPLSFDGVYLNVHDFKELLIGMDVTLFFVGEYLGQDNSFDAGQKRERFCDLQQLRDLEQLGCKLGWHTWTHRDLTKIDSYEELVEEVTPPFPMESFAYPYGRFDKTVIDAVKRAGFEYAYSVYQGDGSKYQLNREYL